MCDEWPNLIHSGEIRGLGGGKRPGHHRPLAGAPGLRLRAVAGRGENTTSDTLTISVGHDARATGETLSQAVIRGLTSADCDVYDAGLATAAAMYLTIASPETLADGAVMVTAGQQPDTWNGFKLMTAKGPLSPDQQRRLLERARGLAVPQRLVTKLDALGLYRSHLEAMVRRRQEDDVQCPLVGLFVAVVASGAGPAFAAWIEGMGADVLLLDPPGGRGFTLEDAEAIEALSRAVLDSEADLGVALDADGVRACVVGQDGRPILRNRMIALMAAILLEESPGATFVTDSVTSSGVARFITEWGGVHYRYKRGHLGAIDEARRLNEEGIDCPLAIETSGHAALRENHFLEDGAYLVTVILCKALELKRDGQALHSLIAELAEPVESFEVRMRILADDYRAAAQSAIEILLSHTLDNPEWRLAGDNREGVRINFDLDGEMDNAWLLLRLSVHEAVMPLNVESDVPGGVRRILGELYELIRDDDELDLEPLRAALNAPDPIRENSANSQRKERNP